MSYLMPDITFLAFAGHTPSLGKDVFVASGARLMGQLTLGNASNVWFNAVIRADVEPITIGQRTNVQDNTVIHVTSGGHATVIGDEVTIGHSAIIHACRIADRCLIGMGAILLDGCTIGEYSLVAAGAVVPPGKSYPPGSLIMGSPAVVKRPLTAQERDDIVASAAHYVDLSRTYAKQEVAKQEVAKAP